MSQSSDPSSSVNTAEKALNLESSTPSVSNSTRTSRSFLAPEIPLSSSSDVSPQKRIVSKQRESKSGGRVLPLMDIIDTENINPDHTLETRKKHLNQLFGIKPWKASIEHRDISERSEVVQNLYNPENRIRLAADWSVRHFGNIFWTLCFGSWLSLFYIFSGALLSATGNIHFGKRFFSLASYILWPFGKVITLVQDSTLLSGNQRSANENSSLLKNSRSPTMVQPRENMPLITKILYFGFCFPLLAIGHVIATLLCWFFVVLIPMGKVNNNLLRYLFKHPEQLAVHSSVSQAASSGQSILLCTYNAFNTAYFKYQVFGMPIAMVNLLPFCLFSILLGSFSVPFKPTPVSLFFMCLLSCIPLAYYIGAAISSISAQSTFAVGAVLNASFGSFIEIILYYNALKQGQYRLVQSAVTGTLLGVMLLLPGLAMIFGGVKYREQFFNRASAGVSNVLLIISLVGAFSPTLFYHIYGRSALSCGDCKPHQTNPDSLNCGSCHYIQSDFSEDAIYKNNARPLMYVCASIMPLCYFVGLLYTLKTHAHIYDEQYRHLDDRYTQRRDLHATAADYDEFKRQNSNELNNMNDEQQNSSNRGGHHGPEWSIKICIGVLLVCSVLFSVIAELLAETITSVTEALSLTEGFLGLTLIAIIPNTAEFVNAVQFAVQDNISLSLEVGQAASVQVSLLQIPVLVIMSALMPSVGDQPGFTLIFPLIDLISVFFSVLVLNYISTDGLSNYFLGIQLVLMYLIFVAAFFYLPTN